jgi:phage baseplate assembly protein W
VDRLGTGCAFPPLPVPVAGALEWLWGPPLVRQSILLILETEPGERVMRPDFGCGLRRFLMEPNTPSTRAAIEREVKGSLTAWEPRIRLTDVMVATTDDPATVLLSIRYSHLRDQTPAVVQVPFALAAPGQGA